MFTQPTAKELKELQGYTEDYCASIYIPLMKSSGSTNPMRIKLKNMMAEVKTKMVSAGASEAEVKKTMRPVNELLKSQESWPSVNESIVMFLHSKLFKVYYVPSIPVPELIHVQKGFNLEPLENILSSTQNYYLLSLNQTKTQLFKGGRFGIEEISPKNFPSNLAVTLGIDEHPTSASSHAVGQPDRDKQSEAFHGHYNAKEETKKQLKEFFRHINQYLAKYLRNEESPLIIGGVDYLLPIYRQVNSYPHLLENSIVGNLERTNNDALLKKAWNIASKAQLRSS